MLPLGAPAPRRRPPSWGDAPCGCVGVWASVPGPWAASAYRVAKAGRKSKGEMALEFEGQGVEEAVRFCVSWFELLMILE